MNAAADLDFDGHCETHRNRRVECIGCGRSYTCTPDEDLWHCPACFDGSCNGRCAACHAEHRREVHRDDVFETALDGAPGQL